MTENSFPARELHGTSQRRSKSAGEDGSFTFGPTSTLSMTRSSAIPHSAGRQSSRRSRSFKVTDFGTNRKPVYDFLLVNNNNLASSVAPFARYRARYWSNCRLWHVTVGIPLSNKFVLSNLCEYRHILLKTRFFGLHFLSQTVWVYVIAPKLPNSVISVE